MKPLISIIVPVYNVEKYLDLCIDSILNQTYRNIEVILVDDGSTDRSTEMCDSWKKTDNRVTVIHQINQGLSAARNKGIDVAKGYYVAFVDSDDCILPNFCQALIDASISQNSDIVVCGFSLITDEGAKTKSISYERKCFDTFSALSKLVSGHIHDYAWNKLYKRELWDDVRYPHGYLFEDIGTTYKVFLKSKRVSCIPDALYEYRQRQGSIVKTMNAKASVDLFTMRKARFCDIYTLNPEIANLGIYSTIISAKELIDKSLWCEIDKEKVGDAKTFLAKHKNFAKAINSKELNLYFKHPNIYKVYRILKHKIKRI